jgi:hypothetical protein
MFASDAFWRWNSGRSSVPAQQVMCASHSGRCSGALSRNRFRFVEAQGLVHAVAISGRRSWRPLIGAMHVISVNQKTSGWSSKDRAWREGRSIRYPGLLALLDSSLLIWLLDALRLTDAAERARSIGSHSLSIGRAQSYSHVSSQRAASSG